MGVVAGRGLCVIGYQDRQVILKTFFTHGPFSAAFFKGVAKFDFSLNQMRYVMFRILLCFSLVLTIANTSQAQLLKRIFGRSSVSSPSCPNGICPTNQSQNWVNRDGLSRRAHTEHVHGVSTAGMSEAEVRQHQNDYHNTYGAGHPVRGAVRATARVITAVPRAGVRAAARVATYPASAAAARASYGSTGSAVQSYGSTGSQVVQGYGSAGSLVVGQPDPLGQIVTEIFPPQPIQQQAAYQALPEISACPCNCPNCKCNEQPLVTKATDASALRIGDRARLMKVMLAAAREARGNSPMDAATVSRMRAAMVDAALEELATSSQAIDIDKWIEIIEKLIPLILKLIEMFGQNSVGLNTIQYAYDDSPLYGLAI